MTTTSLNVRAGSLLLPEARSRTPFEEEREAQRLYRAKCRRMELLYEPVQDTSAPVSEPLSDFMDAGEERFEVDPEARPEDVSVYEEDV